MRDLFAIVCYNCKSKIEITDDGYIEGMNSKQNMINVGLNESDEIVITCECGNEITL